MIDGKSRVKKNCLVCNKEFSVIISRDKKAKYCSYECYWSPLVEHHCPETAFKKGHIPWSKGTKGIMKAWNKGTKGIMVAWNKGKKYPQLAGENSSFFGKHLFGKDSPAYKHGKSRTREYINELSKKRRHEKGISKKYNSESGVSYTKEYKKFQRKRRKAFMKGGGKLSVKTIQQVYEDNIKRFSTLTCYLCYQLIIFGDDHLEHKQPLSRGGTNEYNNLAVSCSSCNRKKHTKTEQEFRKEINQYATSSTNCR